MWVLLLYALLNIIARFSCTKHYNSEVVSDDSLIASSDRDILKSLNGIKAPLPEMCTEGVLPRHEEAG